MRNAVMKRERNRSIRLAGRRLVLFGTPIVAASVLSFHLFEMFTDGVYTHVGHDVETWLAVHLLFLPLLGLLGVGLYLLLDGYEGVTATIGRAGIAVFAVFYIAMEAIAGITVGILVREGRALPVDQQAGVAAVVEALFYDPIVGGGSVSLFAVLGVLGYLVAVVAIAVVLRREGAPRLPLVLLVGSFIAIFSHAGPTGVLGMVLFFVAVVWLELRWAPTAEVSRR
jgi:hypothetical protein